jgi:hypothetical protein
VGSPPSFLNWIRGVECGSRAKYSQSAFSDPTQSSDSGGQISASQHNGSGVQPKGLLLFLASWACAKATFRSLLATADISKTAIITLFDLFEFVGMPFGLRHVDMTFQYLIFHRQPQHCNSPDLPMGLWEGVWDCSQGLQAGQPLGGGGSDHSPSGARYLGQTSGRLPHHRGRLAPGPPTPLWHQGTRSHILGADKCARISTHPQGSELGEQHSYCFPKFSGWACTETL